MVRDENLVVVHYLGGRLAKGYAMDFNQNHDSFHLQENPDALETGSLVHHDELKAVFFVKTLEGNPDYQDPVFSKETIRQMVGMKLRITFRDGEVIYATTQGYSPARKGFFIFPVDRNSNNRKIYVNKASTLSVEVIR